MAPRLFGGVPPQIRHHQRTGADQAQVSANDVPKRGQLVQTGCSKPETEGGHPRGVIDQAPLRVDVRHGAELDQLERLAVQSGASMSEEHRTAKTETNGYCR